MNRDSRKLSFFSKPIALIISILYFSIFLFTIIASEAEGTFLHAVHNKFTRTPDLVTLGERILDFSSIAAPLLLALAFVLIYFLYDKHPQISATAFLVATLVAIGGIAVFACLNVYNIIDIFNSLSNLSPFADSSIRPNYISLLISLISFQALIIFYAGSLASFGAHIKGQTLGITKPSHASFAFGLSNALLAAWHLVLLIFTPKTIINYFENLNIEKTGFIFCEISSIICFLSVAFFAFAYHRYQDNNTNSKERTYD